MKPRVELATLRNNISHTPWQSRALGRPRISRIQVSKPRATWEPGSKCRHSFFRSSCPSFAPSRNHETHVPSHFCSYARLGRSGQLHEPVARFRRWRSGYRLYAGRITQVATLLSANMSSADHEGYYYFMCTSAAHDETSPSLTIDRSDDMDRPPDDPRAYARRSQGRREEANLRGLGAVSLLQRLGAGDALH